MTKQGLQFFVLFLVCLAAPAASFAQDVAEAAVDVDQPSAPPAQVLARPITKLPDRNDSIYYRNKLEFSLETGALPINIPFVFDAFVGGDYSQNPLHYTLVPIFPSLRWHMGKISGPSILRGNTDLTLTLSLTAIPRGPEKAYGAFDLGFRRNFVYRNWRVVPYYEARAGMGFIDAGQPRGYPNSQGQDFTFTLMTGVGARYNIDERWSFSVGTTYMHVSNLYLSQPKYEDYGINVVGPLIGFNMRLGKPKHHSE
jgi:hypothetical protein